MEAENYNHLDIKLKIAAAAADLYTQQEGEFTIHEVAEKADMDVGEIFEYFPNRSAMLDFYYLSLILRYRLMIEEIDDFHTYSLSEKLSNFIYATLDLLDEKRAFVEQSFKPLIRCSYHKTLFEKEAESLLKEFVKDDPGLSAGSGLLLNDLFYKMLLQKYLYIIGYWLKDESEGKERTMEFIDKLTAFLQEVLYTKIADHGFELLKFLITNSGIPSFWDKVSSKIEIR